MKYRSNWFAFDLDFLPNEQSFLKIPIKNEPGADQKIDQERGLIGHRPFCSPEESMSYLHYLEMIQHSVVRFVLSTDPLLPLRNYR